MPKILNKYHIYKAYLQNEISNALKMKIEKWMILSKCYIYAALPQYEYTYAQWDIVSY